MSPKCSLSGSGLCGKCPVGSQYSFTTSTPNSSNNLGMAIPPVELTPSTTTLKPTFLMVSASTKGSSKTSSIWISIYESFLVISPKSSTSANSKSSFSAKTKIFAPCSASKNSPFSFSNLRAFHCLGLWLAVKMIPPSAFSKGTAISTVGVVDNPKSITSIPSPTKVETTKFWIISPDKRASLPMTTFKFSLLEYVFSQVPYAAANLTASTGVRLSLVLPPMVPRIPDIDLISVIIVKKVFANIVGHFRFHVLNL